MNNGTLLAVKLKGRRVFQMLSSVHSVVDVEVGQITLELATQSLNLRLFMTTTSSWGKLTGVIRWWPILASPWGGGRKSSSIFFSWSWMVTFSTSKEPGHLRCKGPFKGNSWRSLLGILASPILFKLEVTSQRKYWALGRSSSSPWHMWFAFLP